ncbi:MAG: hypothetical protein WCK51_12810 [Armatimonadota bacterium]
MRPHLNPVSPPKRVAVLAVQASLKRYNNPRKRRLVGNKNGPTGST